LVKFDPTPMPTPRDVTFFIFKIQYNEYMYSRIQLTVQNGYRVTQFCDSLTTLPDIRLPRYPPKMAGY